LGAKSDVRATCAAFRALVASGIAVVASASRLGRFFWCQDRRKPTGVLVSMPMIYAAGEFISGLRVILARPETLALRVRRSRHVQVLGQVQLSAERR
jgi:hypothetical protein